jgi:hypothetical protein
MQHAPASKLSVFLFACLPVALPATTANAAVGPAPLLASSHGLIQQKQPVPDDPLAGLPTGDNDDHSHHKTGASKGAGVSLCGLEAAPANAREVGDLRATLAFVERGPKSWPCPKDRSLAGEIRLQVAVDGSGKITYAAPATGDSSVASAIGKKLLGQSISPRTAGATRGVVVLTFLSKKR